MKLKARSQDRVNKELALEKEQDRKLRRETGATSLLEAKEEPEYDPDPVAIVQRVKEMQRAKAQGEKTKFQESTPNIMNEWLPEMKKLGLPESLLESPGVVASLALVHQVGKVLEISPEGYRR